MTTAARPTFDPAKGGSGLREKTFGKLSQLVSARDLPGHKKLKERTAGQNTVDEVSQRDLLLELEEREKVAKINNPLGIKFDLCKNIEKTLRRRQLQSNDDKTAAIEAPNDADGSSKGDRGKEEDDEEHAGDRKLLDIGKMSKLDADIDFSDASISGSEDDDDEDHDDEDEEDDSAELMAELNKIRQERALELEKKETEEKSRQERVRSSIDREAKFSVKRRWDDDVPFKNCARDEPDPKKQMYINDTLRQDFHKRFMSKYIR